jgi:hypothetical protein
MSYCVISAPGGVSQPEMRGTVEEQAPSPANVPIFNWLDGTGTNQFTNSSWPSYVEMLKLVSFKH